MDFENKVAEAVAATVGQNLVRNFFALGALAVVCDNNSDISLDSSKSTTYCESFSKLMRSHYKRR